MTFLGQLRKHLRDSKILDQKKNVNLINARYAVLASCPMTGHWNIA